MPVLYTPLNLVIELFLSFFHWERTYLQLEDVHKGEEYSLFNTSRMQNIEFDG